VLLFVCLFAINTHSLIIFFFNLILFNSNAVVESTLPLGVLDSSDAELIYKMEEDNIDMDDDGGDTAEELM
jgi:hypothetical protein